MSSRISLILRMNWILNPLHHLIHLLLRTCNSRPYPSPYSSGVAPLHGQALGVRHAGIFINYGHQKTLLPYGTGDNTAPKRRDHGPLSLSNSTYTVGLIHFLVLWRVYTVFLLIFRYARLVQPEESGLALPVCGLLLLRFRFDSSVFSMMLVGTAVLHQPFFRFPCCESR